MSIRREINLQCIDQPQDMDPESLVASLSGLFSDLLGWRIEICIPLIPYDIRSSECEVMRNSRPLSPEIFRELLVSVALIGMKL